MLTLHNTRTRRKEPFTPQDPARVTMYVCGPTVYNRIHIGNARPFTAFDVLYRVLKVLYPRVDYARNITDIDDKIMKAAREEGVSIGDITARYTQAFHDDCRALGLQAPTVEPRATDHIKQMHELIEQLLARGTAYEAQGHVLFAVQNFESYGQLSNRNLEDMLEGARVEVAPYKRYAGDFVLWKPSADDEPGWDSPWGRGRPGWHLECSAMIRAHLGDNIDIHGGGRDLVFPHHENERAQSCAACGGNFVNYWVHNGYVNIDGEKMSKSLGNFRTVAALLEQYPGEVIRFALLSAHYRSDMDFSRELLDSSKAALDTLYGALRGAEVSPAPIDLRETQGFAQLLDDLNTPGAIAELHRLAKAINKGESREANSSELKALADVLGIVQQDPEVWFKGGADSEVDPVQVEALIQERLDARKNRDFARADAIRQQLIEMGVVLEDKRDGTQWRLTDA